MALSAYSSLLGLELDDTAVMLSYLPLAHIYGVSGLSLERSRHGLTFS